MVKNKKSNITLYFVFMISAIIIIVLAAVLAPMGVLFNTEMYKAGEDILLKANSSIAGINDEAVKAQVYETLDQAFDSQQNNIDINADLFQYSWIIVIVLTGIIVFLYARQIVEIQGGGLI